MRTRLIIGSLIVVAVVAGLAVVLIPRIGEPPPASTPADVPAQDWPVSTPEEQGFDANKLADALQALHDQGTPIDSLLVIRNGSLVLDAYFDPYDASIPHNLASVSKSFMTTLVGIAAEQGHLQLDQPVLSFFPERTIAHRDARKEAMTVRHLAGMVNGFKSGCLAGDGPTLNAMRENPDWVQAALDRPMATEPGARFCYDSPGMHLLSAIVQQTTGMTALDFARQNLFAPLGIENVAWQSDPLGVTHGWGDLYLTPRDTAKLGYLWLNNGIWQGQQIVAPDWVQNAVTAHAGTSTGDDYGYGWWIADDGYYASGRGGQMVSVVPALQIVIVVTGSGVDYDQVGRTLKAALVDPQHPLPANPAGVARLAATVAALAPAAVTEPAEALPPTAQAISGRTYRFGPNPANLATLRLAFDDPAEATVDLTLRDPADSVTWIAGLDGKYRTSPDGPPARGYWADPQTFVLTVLDIGERTYALHFDDDRLAVKAPGLGLDFEGQAEQE